MPMNMDIFKGNWKMLKGKVTIWRLV